jgi:hypothetical protein
MAKPLPDAEFIAQWQRFKTEGLTGEKAARKMGYAGYRQMHLRRQRMLKRGTATEADLPNWSDAIHVHAPDSPEVPIDELLARRKRDFARRRNYEVGRALIECQVKEPGPIALLHFGDPHVDDDGTDLATLERHMKYTHEAGVYGCNIGDTTNNWVGRLAALFSEQATTASQAWQLAEWFVTGARWLYLIGGNHDGWSGAGDPLKWICRQQQALYESSEVRIALRFPNKREVRINARHDFEGSSQWNPAHGPMKAAQLGVRDDIVICGHKHKSGYSILKAPGEDRLIHCIQVASYKLFDRYARSKGFRDQHISPAVLTIIDPAATQPLGLVRVEHDVDQGMEIFRWLRKKRAA